MDRNVHKLWVTVLVILFSKVSDPRTVQDLRPPSMISALQKWYTSCLVLIAEKVAARLACEIYGFTRGRQACEVSSLVSLLPQKCRKAGISLFVANGDASQAFDSMKQNYLHESLLERGCPNNLAAALVRENIEAELIVKLANVNSELHSTWCGRKSRRMRCAFWMGVICRCRFESCCLRTEASRKCWHLDRRSPIFTRFIR